MRRATLSVLGLALVLALGAGCATRGVAARTLPADEGRERDVVWVERGDEVFRCSAPDAQPSCERAERPEAAP